jgi:tetratricopeptide (TPR) repeat protein
VAHLPGDGAALTALAIVEWKLGAREAAERRLEQALPSHLERLYSLITLAQMKMAGGNPAGAEALLRAAAAGGEAAAAIALAEFHAVAGRVAEAESELRRVLASEPRNAAALLDLAAVEASRNRMEAAAAAYRTLAKLPDRRYRGIYASFLQQTGRADLAAAEFERLSMRDPADDALRTSLLGAYLAAGREADAERMLRQAAGKRDAGFDALLQKAVFDLGKGRIGESQVNVMAALRLRPEAAEARYLLAAVRLRRGEVLGSVEELSQAVLLNPQFLPARLELARYRIASRAPDVALEVLGGAPAGQRSAPLVEAVRGWALLAMGEPGRFRAELQAAGQGGGAGALRIPSAVFQLEQGNPAAARRIAEDLLEAHPGDMRALLLLARSRNVASGAAAAIQSVRRWAESRPRSPGTWLLVGELQLAAGQPREAMKALQTAEAAGAPKPELESGMARAELRSGQVSRAENRLAALVAANPADVPARFLLGAAQQMEGAYQAAAETYRKALEDNPSHVPALHNLAYLLAEHLGMPEEALHLAEKARELAPESAAVDDALGWVLYRRGLNSLAAIHLKEAAAAGYGRASAQLARLWTRPDDPADALKALADPVALGWVDLGAADNTEARLETYRKRRGCQPDETALDAVLRERNPRRFTERIVLPLMLCEPQPVFTAVALPPPLAATMESIRAKWTNPELMLQRLFGFSGVNAAEAPGWDNTFISWDETRSGLQPRVKPSPYNGADSAFRTAPEPQDANGWNVYDSLWPQTFH